MNAIELLTNDHRDVERMFADFESDAGEGRAEILARIIRELSIHSSIEEAYFYPRIRREAENGAHFAAEGEREHQHLKESLARLDAKLDEAHTAEVAGEVEALKQTVMDHVDEEQNEVFPALAQTARRRELDDIGKQLRKAKGSAPTRPHPRQPKANPLTSRANGMIDRVRDRVAGRTR
ncbi:MAG TPA: hemerythrin domain-containing protein [Candidatus Dormibacteraeota bacterium]